MAYIEVNSETWEAVSGHAAARLNSLVASLCSTKGERDRDIDLKARIDELRKLVALGSGPDSAPPEITALFTTTTKRE